MSYHLEFSDAYQRDFKKIKKKDPVRASQIKRKLEEVVLAPERFKPLRNILAGFYRLHFGSFVLIYCIEGDCVYVVGIEHHDDAY